MPEGFRRSLSGCLLVVLALLSTHAVAVETVGRLARRLAEEKDFRVRTQAALALGAAKSAAAVSPLCLAVASDASATVRAAAAAALGKLKQGGSTCLKSSLAKEADPKVRSSLRRALANLDVGPAITPTTKYYVAISKASVATGDAASVDAILRRSMRQAAKDLPTLVIAPDDEPSDKAKGVLRKYKRLKGFYLAPRVFEPKYRGGDLKVKMELAVFSYPAQSLLGSFSVDLTAQGVSPGDKDTENSLLKMVAERALKKFSLNAEQF